MSFLFRLLVLVLIISLVRRVIAVVMRHKGRAAGPGQRSRFAESAPRTITGKMIKDPYCGTYVASELAVTLQSGGRTLHFCSGECRDRYRLAQSEKAPLAR